MADRPVLTVVGLGPGSPAQLTVEAKSILEAASTVYVRTVRHPTVAALEDRVQIRSFDERYEAEADLAAVYARIVDDLLATARREGAVVYAVPGHPLVGEATVTRLLADAPRAGVGVRIVPGLSFVDAVLAALGQDALPGLQVLDALEMGRFDATLPLLVGQIHNRRTASHAKLALASRFPDEHRVALVTAAGVPGEEAVEWLPLYQLDQGAPICHLTALWVPPLPRRADLRAVVTLRELMADLRAPAGGCPWDRQQTHESLRPYLLEETYETLEAIDRGDLRALEEELGDLLLQIAFHAQLAEEEGQFDLGDVAAAINAKLIRRHPHVFGDRAVRDASEVLQSWEALKREERRDRQAEEQSMLDGVPPAMPALAHAQAIQQRAARVGFDWPDVAGVLDKVREEIAELTAESAPPRRTEELGDLLFALVNLARWLDVDAEAALRAGNRKFRGRFAAMERAARARGQTLDELSAEALDELWHGAKAGGGR